MIVENNKRLKLVGQRRDGDYAAVLEKLLGAPVTARPIPVLAEVLKKEKCLFAKKIEVLYDVAPVELRAFISQELSATQFEVQEILSQRYYEYKYNQK